MTVIDTRLRGTTEVATCNLSKFKGLPSRAHAQARTLHGRRPSTIPSALCSRPKESLRGAVTERLQSGYRAGTLLSTNAKPSAASLSSVLCFLGTSPSHPENLTLPHANERASSCKLVQIECQTRDALSQLFAPWNMWLTSKLAADAARGARPVQERDFDGFDSTIPCTEAQLQNSSGVLLERCGDA